MIGNPKVATTLIDRFLALKHLGFEEAKKLEIGQILTNYCQILVLIELSNYYCTVVCKIVHRFASVWCKTALGEVGVSLP